MMKLSFRARTVFLLLIASGSQCSAFAPTTGHSRSFRRFSTTQDDTDAAFSAFAESLEENDLFESDDEAAASGTLTWQENLESLLDPTTPLAKRQILLSDLVNANENIRSDVESALRDRKVCKHF